MKLRYSSSFSNASMPNDDRHIAADLQHKGIRKISALDPEIICLQTIIKKKKRKKLEMRGKA